MAGEASSNIINLQGVLNKFLCTILYIYLSINTEVRGGAGGLKFKLVNFLKLAIVMIQCKGIFYFPGLNALQYKRNTYMDQFI